MTESTIVIIDLFLALYAFMLARSREIKTYQVILIGLCGFLMAMTPFGYPVWWTFLFIGNHLIA